MYINYLAPTVADSSFCNHGDDVIEGEWNDAGGNTFADECAPDCPGDVTGDDTVNVTDLLAVIAAWGTDDPAADTNGDGMVGIDDLLAVLSSWGICD